jgi:hypothetical protein
VNDQIRRLRARAQALREHAARADDPRTYEELLLAARGCEKLAVQLETEVRAHRLQRPSATRRLRERQKLH